jgi:RecA-family ATPase
MTDHSANPFVEDERPPDGFYRVAYADINGVRFTREADGRWFDQWRNEAKWINGQIITTTPVIKPYSTHSLSRWKDKDIGTPLWFMEDWIPFGRPVGLYGKPGARKSTLMLQWMIACTLGKGFGPCPHLAYGPAYGLFCEDDEDIIAWRALAILKHYGASFADMTDCHAESLVDANLTTFCTFTREGQMHMTPAWEKFIEDITAIKPVFVCLDVMADFFGGDEIKRREASAFMSLLHQTAKRHRFALVFSAHPSLTGINSGTMNAGSTGWEGKTGARLVLEDPSDDDEDNIFPNQSDKRCLTLAKANYAKPGETLRFVIRDGVFIPEALDPNNKSSGPAEAAAAERAFLDRLKTRLAQGRYVSPKRGNTAGYAPAVLAGDGFTMTMLDAAMQRLFDRGTIRFDAKAKNPCNRWVFSDQGGV